MSDYLLQHGTRATPQTEQADPAQVRNDAGGFVFQAGDWEQLRRWLILGSESGTYYVGQRELSQRNVAVLDRCLAADGPQVVAAVVAVSEAGLAPSNEPALFALARAISVADPETRRAAAVALPRVARTGTMLFHFVSYAETMRGWGKTLRRAVAGWYAQPAGQVAYQAVKYRQRDGVSHRDLLRLCHARPETPEHQELFGFISGNVGHSQGADERGRTNRTVLPWRPWSPEDDAAGVGGGPASLEIIEGYLFAQAAESPQVTANLVRDYRLPWEALNSDHRMDPEVQRALLDAGMPLHALTRNLANMTRAGILDGSYLDKVLGQLGDRDYIRRSRLHPMALLIALRTYASGHGFRGQNTWTPISRITDALDAAFYLAFDNVESTGKRTLLAIDVSGSMTQPVGGLPLTAKEAAVAMALITLHAEPDLEVIGFTQRLYPLGLSARQRLDDAVRSVPQTGEGTDCSLPFGYAYKENKGRPFDVVVGYTDQETWAGSAHVHQLVRELRDRTGRQTKAVTVAMTATGSSILDPEDPLSLNVVGFDASAPQVISAFVAGQV